MVDSLGLCKVPALSIIADFKLENALTLIQALSGLQLSAKELLTIGERIVNMEKIFNLVNGATMESDNLPEMFQRQSLYEGPAKGMKLTDLSAMVSDFYRAMGWDDKGVPNPETLKRLSLKIIE